MRRATAPRQSNGRRRTRTARRRRWRNVLSSGPFACTEVLKRTQDSNAGQAIVVGVCELKAPAKGQPAGPTAAPATNDWPPARHFLFSRLPRPGADGPVTASSRQNCVKTLTECVHEASRGRREVHWPVVSWNLAPRGQRRVSGAARASGLVGAGGDGWLGGGILLGVDEDDGSFYGSR